jgi:hypothetical protein
MTTMKEIKKRRVWPWLVLGVFVIGMGILYLLIDYDRVENETGWGGEATSISPVDDEELDN